MTDSISVKSMHHVSLSVSDLDKSIEFYSWLGFKPEKIRKGLTADYFRQVIGYPDAVVDNALLQGPDHVRLELMRYVHPKGDRLQLDTPNIGSVHICFVVEDIFALYQQLLERGVRFISEPVAIPSGPNSGGYAVYLRDPDDYTMELVQIPNS